MGIFDWILTRAGIISKIKTLLNLMYDARGLLYSLGPLQKGISEDWFNTREIELRNVLRAASSMESEIIPEVERLEKSLLAASGLKEFRDLSEREKEAISFFGALTSETKQIIDNLDALRTLYFAKPYDHASAVNKYKETVQQLEKDIGYIQVVVDLMDQIVEIKNIRKAA